MTREEIAESIVLNFKEVLGLRKGSVVEWDQDFSDFGMNSINAAKFSSVLSNLYDLNLTPGIIIEHYSVSKLARYLLEDAKIGNALDKSRARTQPELATTTDQKVRVDSHTQAGEKAALAEKIINELLRRSAKNGGDKVEQSYKVSVPPESERDESIENHSSGISETIDFSFIFFSSHRKEPLESKYGYVTAITQYADANGFKAIWVPERHFHEFGGIFPNPALLLANLASTTKSIRLRAGSVVLPLHHPASVVETWSMLDNLSNGRVDMAFASGWNPNDFVLSRETFATSRETWFERMAQVERLWEGKAVEFYNGKQELVPIKIYPQPVQKHLGIWMAITGNPESFVEAGKRGYNILTMLQSKPVEELAANIARYRRARAEQGLDPRTGVVSLMLHAYVHENQELVDTCVNEHYFDYIKSGLQGHIQAMDPRPSDTEIDNIVEHSFHYQRKHSALFGDVSHCQTIVEKLRRIGVNEVACLVDFGISEAQMLETLPYIRQLKSLVNKPEDKPSVPMSSLRRSLQAPMLATDSKPQEYAIVGMAGRYPGAKTLEGFWDNLLANKSCIGEINLDRYDWREYWGNPKTEMGKTNIKHFGLIDDIYHFDAGFFGISKREAEVMDPHARLLLETAWQCIENAGYLPQSLKQSRTGVFLSFYNTDYNHLVESLEIDRSSAAYLGTALGGALKANRISYLLGLTGPSETYDTACSSALVALHRAIQSMTLGDCDQALVAGVSLLLAPGRVISLSKMGLLNESGVCNPFSYPPNKEVIGEGVGALLIKPLARAIASKDYIYAVVSGSDVNHQGNSSGSLTMPSADSLTKLMETTYHKTGVHPRQVRYIEGHGSGNDSDLVELLAFQRCFEDLPSTHRTYVGSVKSNIGFGEGSGGMAQIAKCALSLNHGVMPATINFERADPSVDTAMSRIAIQTSNVELDYGRDPDYYISVLAYGLGGTNAHILLRNHSCSQDEYAAPAHLTHYPMLFSAANEAVLTAYLQDMQIFFRRGSVQRNYLRLCGTPERLLTALSRTMLERERRASHRLVLLVSSYDDLLNCLSDALVGTARTGIVRPDSAMPSGPDRRAVTSKPGSKSIEEMAAMWVNGVSVDWSACFEGKSFQRLALPPAPFRGEELRLKPKVRGVVAHVGLEQRMRWAKEADGILVSVDIHAQDYFIREHVVDGMPIVPAVGYLAVLSEIARRVYHQPRCSVRNIAWLMPFSLGTADYATMEFQFGADGQFRVFHKQNQTLYCKGQLLLGETPRISEVGPQLELQTLGNSAVLLDRNDYWKWINSPESKQRHGESLRRVSGLYRQGEASVCVLEIDSAALALPEIPIYDGALGSCLGIALINQDEIAPAVPFSMEAFHALAPIPDKGSVYAIARRRAGKFPRFDISLEDSRGAVLALFSGYFAKTFEALPSLDPQTALPFAGRSSAKPPVEVPVVSNILDQSLDQLRKSLIETFQTGIAKFLKLAVEDVPVDEGLERLGLDSIGVNELTAQLSEQLAIDLPATLMFEYTNIKEVVEYLLEMHSDEVQKSLGLKAAEAAPAAIGKNTNIAAAATYQPLPVAPPRRLASTPVTDIAVIGIGGVFPGATDVHDFWDRIKSGHDLIAEMPVSRRETVYRIFSDAMGGMEHLYAGFVDKSDSFDAAFFDLSDEEVLNMDPQQRLFLVACWQALEDAGYHPLSLPNKDIGIYVGAAVNEYAEVLSKAAVTWPNNLTPAGNAMSGIANRASYFFDLNGPSQAIDTACCSSLYAVDQAVSDIRMGRCSAALVGGVNYIGTPYGFTGYAMMDFLAKDWRCKAFADGGDGWSKGELFAAVYLKPLNQALEDKDAIYAVIKASGTNHGGKSHFYAQPNSTKHLELVTKVCRDGGLDPRDLVHIEAHGTGTEMGDAIEYNVMLRAMSILAKERGVTLDPHSCGCGSIKSNMGHAEAAAGIAGLIKTVLLLHEKVIPPSLHIKAPNKHIRLNNAALYLATEEKSFAQRSHHGQGHHAAVHSFNFSGATAHVLVAEAPELALAEGNLGLKSYPCCLSAPSVEGLQAYLQAFIRYLEANPASSLDGLAYTLNRSKSHFSHRLAITARSIAELRQQFIDASQAIVDGRLASGESRIGEGITYRHLEHKMGRKVRDYARLSDENVPLLLDHWLREGGFDWSVVLAPYRLAKLHLPVYAFVNGRIYFPRVAGDGPLRTAVITATELSASADHGASHFDGETPKRTSSLAPGANGAGHVGQA